MSGNDPGNQGRSDEDADDVRLMRLVGRGDTVAFEKLVERHQALVAGTVARMLGSNSDVEDIAQQVFIRVWKSARRYVPRAKFTTWLLKITRNLVFNELRRTKRRAHVPLQPEAGTEDLPLKDDTNPAPDASLLDGRAPVVTAARAELERVDPFAAPQIETALRGLAERLELSPRKAFEPIRVAVTGSKISPGLFESIELLGKEKTLRRLDAAAARLEH